MKTIARLRHFIQNFTLLIERIGHDENRIFADGKQLLSDLVSHDNWLPDRFARPNPDRYQQYLLYCDPMERFCVVSFVWGPGQTTPVHDHTVWGLVGVMRGAELCEEFDLEPSIGRLCPSRTHQLCSGVVDLISPRVGDIHRVANALADRTSISIHVYGANIGAIPRNIYETETGLKKRFVSGYSNNVTPNLWDRSTECTSNNG